MCLEVVRPYPSVFPDDFCMAYSPCCHHRPCRAEPTFHEDKLAELILYIAERSEHDKEFGKTKLLKLIAYSDFGAYQRLGRPITGAHYRKLPHGPAPREAPETLEILEE